MAAAHTVGPTAAPTTAPGSTRSRRSNSTSSRNFHPTEIACHRRKDRIRILAVDGSRIHKVRRESDLLGCSWITISLRGNLLNECSLYLCELLVALRSSSHHVVHLARSLPLLRVIDVMPVV